MAEFLVDSYSESNAYGFSWSYSGYRETVGQSFTGKDGRVSSAKFYCKKVGSPTGNVYAKLYAHTGTYGSTSAPTGSALVTSNAIDITTLSTDYALITFTFPIPYQITEGAYYCIAINYAGGDSSNKLETAWDESSPSHSGNGFINTTPDTVDACFYVYAEPAFIPQIIIF